MSMAYMQKSMKVSLNHLCFQMKDISIITNLINMTVQELIDYLCKIDDKSMQVVQDNFEEIYNIGVVQGNVVLRSW